MLTDSQQKKLILHLQKQVEILTKQLKKEKMQNKELTHQLMRALRK